MSVPPVVPAPIMPPAPGKPTAGPPLAERTSPLAADRVDRTTAPGKPALPPSSRGFGLGVMAGATVEAGVGAGFAASAGAGVGLFFNGSRETHAGAYADAGAFAGVGRHGAKMPQSADSVNVGGAFAGAGVGAFVTNATSVDQLRGIAQTYSINLGVGPLKFSAQLGASEGTFVGALSVGPGIGADASRYPTQSVTKSW